MKKLILLLVAFPLFNFAQDSGRFIDKGLLSGKGTLAIGSPTAYSGTNMYISGNIEYYLEKNVSFKSGIWLFLGTSGADDVFAKNSTLFTGFYYHIKTNNHLDPYIGFESGLSWTQLQDPTKDFSTGPVVYPFSRYPQALSPVASLGVGINYYASDWVHLFAEIKYIEGVHVSDIPAVSLSEFRVAFGFGFNMWANKKKKKK